MVFVISMPLGVGNARGSALGAGAIPDVRVHLSALRREVLGPSCCLLFSRITPLGAANPQEHPLWRLATEVGGCSSAACRSMPRTGAPGCFTVCHKRVAGPPSCSLAWLSPGHLHLWRPSQLGARCVLGIEDGITHVVASDVTEKTRWAVKHRKHVVGPEWLRRSGKARAAGRLLRPPRCALPPLAVLASPRCHAHFDLPPLNRAP